MKLELACRNCGRKCPVNKEKSTENWQVHHDDKKCECGVKDWTFEFVKEEK